MSTAWAWRSCVIIPIALQATANAYAAQLDPDEGGADTFVENRLSASGSEPAAALMATIPVTATLYPAMDALEAAGDLPGMVYYRWTFDTQILVATNSTTATVGAAWSVGKSLEDAAFSLIPGASLG